MDAGSFVLDLDGVRWAKDLGMQSYNSLESKGIDLWNMSQNSQRWQVFRISAQAHNTLTLNDQAHRAKGMASLRMLNEREVLIDLTPALLPGQVGQVTRQAKFTNEAVQLTDQIRGAKQNTLIRWAMNTEANVHIEGNSVELMQQGKRLLIKFEGKELQLSAADISAPKHDFDAPNPNVKQVIVTSHTNTDGSWTLGARFSRGA
jgi:aspartate 1-decarboxylase